MQKVNGVLYHTAPSKENRLEKEMRVYELLEKLEVPFVRVDHEVTATIEECLEVEKVLQIEICKNLFLCTANKSQFYLLMMPGEKKFKTSEASKKIGSSRLSFATEDYMEEYLDITPGSVSVLGLMNDVNHKVQLVIDAEILEAEYVGCHPCINTSSLKIKTKDLLEIILPYIEHEPMIIEL